MKPRFLLQVLLAAASLAGIVPAAGRAQAPPRRIEITASRFNYNPGTITLKRGEPVILVLKSADVAHGLRFRDLHVDLNARAGSTAQIGFTPDKIGEFIGHCSVFCGSGHGSMQLRLHVVN
ncbi:cupredoxin domain-containing protein [Acidicapsa acidisoli]|uniref:cupredoxin domain-containing protein n=1 Tax=Acidicapsa acidisoli TaxID=1615681 RepID=UPI0021DF4F50|nr:cupredoxin domain-containing protein [Acidicapsa acidisoli]